MIDIELERNQSGLYSFEEATLVAKNEPLIEPKMETIYDQIKGEAKQPSNLAMTELSDNA
jgi:hypothetical protein